MLRASTIGLGLAGLVLWGCGPTAEGTGVPVRSCESTLVLTPEESVQLPVFLEAEWNAFAPERMEQLDDGRWRAKVVLPARSYAYRFVVNDAPLFDPSNAARRWVGAQEYSLLRVPDCASPQLEVQRFEPTAQGTLTLEVQYFEGSAAKGPDAAAAELSLDGTALSDVFDVKTGRFVVSVEGLAPGKHTVRVRAADAEGRAAEALYLPFWVEPAAFRWDGALMYFTFTDRFRNGDPANDAPVEGADAAVNFRGGDFAGIRAAIEEGYFDALGVNVLWLSPSEANPEGTFSGTFGKRFTGYHGYWPSAPRTTQRRFGSLSELQALTAAAHARGMRVIMDLVLNHVHDQHPYFAAHRSEGWFHVSGACTCGTDGCSWDARVLDCWFTPYLPDVNWRSAPAAEHLVADAMWWLREADLDGFRIDAVKHMEQVAVRNLAAELDAVSALTGADFYLVGETFTGVEGRPQLAQTIGRGALDGQFDFPLYWPVVDAFARGESLALLGEALAANATAYPEGTVNAPFLGNHDVPRFLSIAAGEVEGDGVAQAWSANLPQVPTATDLPYARAKDAFTFLLTQPGAPLIYYGDEVGLPGAGDPDNRRMMKWQGLSAPEAGLLEHVRRLGQTRRESTALQRGALEVLVSEPDLLVYQRSTEEGAGAVVAFHRGSQARTVELSLRGTLATGVRSFRESLSGRTASSTTGALVLELAPGAREVWTSQE